ncbi:protein SET isoform X2 [Anthonomus grandis grandis]|uniref:protein SET isoform X2 n=1 Tax=Anthonomus grandis grandis TaxID=2921223 RepID=UPI0021661CA0|nr:protein SET isoform X2 [Anthonomus grandis grandis]
MSAENKKFKRTSESDRTSDYDHTTQKTLEEIDLIQNQLDSINEKAAEEILQIERKYNRLRKPQFEKRNQLISNIPNFWVTAMMNHPDISNLFTGQEEEDCLHHLTKVEIEEFEDIVSGYSIKFYFDENPYFDNPVLTKEYHLSNDAPTSKSTLINWKDGIMLGQSSQDTGNKTNRKRRLESMKTSFFTWFSDNVDPYTDDIAEDFKLLMDRRRKMVLKTRTKAQVMIMKNRS